MPHSAEMLKYIETARQMETTGLRFYRNALTKVNDENSRGLLNFLVGEEEEHLAYFTGLEVKSHDVINLRPLKAPLFKKNAYRKITSRRSQTVQLFNTALEMEEVGIRYYSKMAARTRDRNIRKFLIHIVNMEKQHFKLIKEHQRAIYDAWYWEAMEMPALNT